MDQEKEAYRSSMPSTDKDKQISILLMDLNTYIILKLCII